MARVGKYDIIRPLARGPLTEISLAHMERGDGSRQPVALKRLLPRFSRDMEVVSTFLNEARITARLKHPNIVEILDLGVAGKDYFVVLEYIHGLDLDEVQQGCQKQGFFMPYPLITQILIQICRGLHHAHSATNEAGQPLGVVHRNLHPQNIIIDMRGQLKLVDFGLAKNSRQRSGHGGSKGSNAYHSPEQCRGEAVDPRSDIFSAGTILYELCCRRRLFRRRTEFATARAILDDPIPPPSAVSDEVPDALEMIIMHALARNPQYRYDSAETMEQELLQAARENEWSLNSRALAAFMGELVADHPPPQTDLRPEPIPIIPATPEEETKLENPDGLDQLRTPGGTAHKTPLSQPSSPLQDFWSVTTGPIPQPLPALQYEPPGGDLADLPEAEDVPMALAGVLDSHEGDDDAKTIVRRPTPSHEVLLPVSEVMPEQSLVFELHDGEEQDPLDRIEKDQENRAWGQRPETGLEMYSDIPEATDLPRAFDGRPPIGNNPNKKPQGFGRETMQVKPISAIPAPRTSRRTIATVVVVGLLLVGGLTGLLWGLIGSPGSGTIVISSEPTGAKVAVDGKERFGSTPQTMADLVLDRPYLLVVFKEGYLPWKKKFTLSAQQSQRQFLARLQRRGTADGQATLVVQTAEPGARVFLDGQLKGKTPLTIKSVDCKKRHTLVLNRERYVDLVQDVKGLKPGQQRKIEVALTPDHAERQKGVLPASRSRIKEPDDGPVEIPRTAPPVRRLRDTRVGETLPGRVPKKLDR